MNRLVALLDTNIFVYSSNKYTDSPLKQYIDVLLEKNIELVLSKIILAELLANADKRKRDAAYKWTTTLKRLEVTSSVLEVTGYFSRMYAQEKFKIGSPDLGDTIIAATAFLEQTYILTADVNDFPRPFFLEHDHALLQYQKDNTIRTIFIALLQPNNELISDYLRSSH